MALAPPHTRKEPLTPPVGIILAVPSVCHADSRLLRRPGDGELIINADRSRCRATASLSVSSRAASSAVPISSMPVGAALSSHPEVELESSATIDELGLHFVSDVADQLPDVAPVAT